MGKIEQRLRPISDVLGDDAIREWVRASIRRRKKPTAWDMYQIARMASDPDLAGWADRVIVEAFGPYTGEPLR